ncbi:MAG TPA: glutamine-hydrolyzing GMP synthase [Bacteroidia bacterium]|nr:glutamine-hydrolyzing GMP synthase [Bacteroidia bacterium]
MHQSILIIDFGSQYTQLIARRVRELNVYCEIHPYNKLNNALKNVSGIKGIILSGSPSSVRDSGSPQINIESIRKKFPILGVCYGAQLLAQQSGGEVKPSLHREYGRANLSKINDGELFTGIENGSQVWMSHADTITKIPSQFIPIASTNDVAIAAFKISDEKTFGIQFHPEVTHTSEGKTLLKNFVCKICGCSGDWTASSFIDETVRILKEKIGNEKIILAISGGVDSTVAAVLLNKAVGKNLYCIFVDNGLLRKNEFKNVLDAYSGMGLNVEGIDAKKKFYDALKNITDPELKRKAIGKTFIEVFDEAAHRINDVKWLGQGTIYPDVIESVSVKGPSATIKSHHNVGGLPDTMKLKIIEPLRMLFKDEIRTVGKELGITIDILGRHPFPGPGLAIRIICDITEEKVRMLQEADDIFISALKRENLYDKVWQAAAILLPVQTVGVMGDERTYENVLCLRAVNSVDGMTADWSPLPHDFLAGVSSAITNRVKGINRVVYDISSKPPATIEWE